MKPCLTDGMMREYSMHITFLEFVTQLGGAPRSTVDLARRLKEHVDVSIIDPYGCAPEFAQAVRDAGVNYHVLCPDMGKKIIGGGRNVLSRMLAVTKSLPHLLHIQKQAKKVIRDIQPSVILSNNPKSLSIVGGSFALRRVPLVAMLRGWYMPTMIPYYARWLYRHRCSSLFAVSYATRSAVICSGIPSEKVEVLQNPIDAAQMLEYSQRPLTSPIPNQGRAVKILLPAQLLVTKGQDTAVRALHRVITSGHDAVLNLAGELPTGSETAYVERTKALAHELGVSDRVAWLGLRDDIPQLMKHSDIVILPSHSEGMPRSILEAMALGKPVVATPVGGVLDLILPGISGLLHDVGEVAGLADGINALIDNPQTAREIGHTAQRYVRDHFTPAKHTIRTLSLLEKAIHRGKPRNNLQ